MGADIETRDRRRGVRSPWAGSRRASSRSHGVEVPARPWCPRLIDEVPALAAAATQADGSAIVSGAARAAHQGERPHRRPRRGPARDGRPHRGAARRLRAIEGGPPAARRARGLAGDHRIAMALCGGRAWLPTGETAHRGRARVRVVSFPEFYALLASAAAPERRADPHRAGRLHGRAARAPSARPLARPPRLDGSVDLDARIEERDRRCTVAELFRDARRGASSGEQERRVAADATSPGGTSWRREAAPSRQPSHAGGLASAGATVWLPRATLDTILRAWSARRQSTACRRIVRQSPRCSPSGSLLPPGRPARSTRPRRSAAVARRRRAYRASVARAVARPRAARRTTESMKYLILSDIHSNREALAAVLPVRQAQALGQGGLPRRPRRLRRQPEPGGGHAAPAAAAGGDPRQPRQGLLGPRGRRAVQPHRAARPRCGRARSSRRSNLQLAAVAARGPRGRRRRVRDLPTARPIDEDAYIFGEIEALNVLPPHRRSRSASSGTRTSPCIFAPLARRDHDRAHRRAASFRFRLEPGVRYLDQPRLDRPAARRQPARLVRDLRQRHPQRHDPPRALQAWSRRSSKILDAGLPRPLADRLALEAVTCCRADPEGVLDARDGCGSATTHSSLSCSRVDAPAVTGGYAGIG